MSDIKETYKGICEIAKLLELGQIQEPNEALRNHWFDYYCFLDSSVDAILNKYGNGDSKEYRIAKAFIKVFNTYYFVCDINESNFDKCWSYIAKIAKECNFLSALESFGKMDDFDELTKDAKPIDPNQLEEVEGLEDDWEFDDEIPEEISISDFYKTTNEKVDDKKMKYIYLPNTNKVVARSSSIKSISLTCVDGLDKNIQYLVDIEMKQDKASNDIACKNAISQISESLQEDGLPSRKTNVEIGSNDTGASTLILKGSEVFSIEGLQAYKDYLERKQYQDNNRRQQLFYN